MKKYVLIVDDEPDLLAIESTIVEEAGFVPVTALSAREAMQKLRKQAFACILTDIKLLDGSGDEIIQYVRDSKRMEVDSTTPIIVVSGNIDKALLQKVGKLVNGILVKPFTAQDLKNKLVQIKGPVAKVA
jgi:CheY-like chemotaxis protein